MPEPAIVPAPEAAEEQNPQLEEIKERVAETIKPLDNGEVEEVEEIDDPSKFEGLGGRPKVKSKKTAEERIGEITKNYRTEERKNVDLTEKHAELEKKLKEATDKIAEFAAKSVAPAEPKVEPKPAVEQNKLPDIDKELESLWAEHEKASEELDGAKTSKIFRKIHTLESKRLKEATVVKPEYIDKAIREKEEKKAVIEFSKNNLWFSPNTKQGANNPSYDMEKSNYALAVEASLLPTFKGSYSELLNEIEKRVDKLFNLKQQKRATLPNVSGVNTLKSHTPTDNIILTPIQKSFIQKTGMKEEDYKAELKKMRRK